ncbi:ATP-binding protein [Paenarthrobacter sp. CM16]|uniref:ATP-binding protein n=1 Tax=Paenarthrobacter sp. CM16 TaxID=2738447 RepID=UPI0015516A0B|nr:ATP-binding protein [Paenarthrobacter sp. CM16]NQD88852.1 ATP-binding protein [Paenarthrobacter sp. CM16]
MQHSEWEIVQPSASPVFEALRAFGYTPETSIADLVDNSIAARAKNVYIAFVWNDGDAYIVIKDDGVGMSEKSLVDAMRLGSQSPAVERQKGDLGRFGLGLKTASIAQAREFSVVTTNAANRSPVVRRWDLDEIQQSGEWRLRSSLPNQAVDDIAFAETGTAVVWTKCDRLIGDPTTGSRMTKAQFLRVADSVSNHLGMTFHRFLGAPRRLRISVNGSDVRPWDPFLSDNASTYSPGTEALPMQGQAIKVTPYVLPHKSKLDIDEHKRAGGIQGWNAHQGFYVYREDRLLVSGSWLGVGGMKEEHSKLARIALDVPIALDHMWQVDVRKSQIRPPASIVRDLERIGRTTKTKAQEVYRFRGKIAAARSSQAFVFAWLQHKDRDMNISYRINRDNPVVRQVLDASPEYKVQIEHLLRFVEETVPMTQIAVHLASSLESSQQPFDEDTRGLRELLEFSYSRMLTSGASSEQVLDVLASTEPFSLHPGIVAAFKESVNS